MAKMVTIYPTEPVGEVRVPGVPAEVQEVTEERAAELLAYTPPAFTTLKSGRPTPDQIAGEKARFHAAWPELAPETDEVAASADADKEG